MKRRGLLLTALVSPAAGLLPEAPATAAPSEPAAAGRAKRQPLTNVSHLDFLRDEVSPPPLPDHSTYRISESPRVGVLWTYAELQPDGTMRRVGGGHYDPATDTWGQGAYNADDMARAAVVYLRHWKQTGARSSRDASYALLRGLTYLQTVSGQNAGNVVLWMQPDGTLHPSPDPKDSPDPSDSGPSYWLARTVWALGEGYAAWRDADPAFAEFLAERMELAVAALDRQVLVRYGTWRIVHGERLPAWLIVDGADTTAEAVLGLAAYAQAGGNAAGREALRKFAEGIAALSGGDVQHWPFGAVRPWALSLSVWHAWASQMPAALARAGAALRDRRLVRPAVTDSAVFTPWLLTSGGPDNGRLPTPVDHTQIAYGVDSRVQSLVAVADVTGEAGFRRLAGVTAAWFFGANPAGVAAYDQSTGRTIDGIGGDGKVNRNSGAESTIHCLLTMLALDAHPDVAAIARRHAIVERVGTAVVEAEQGDLSGGATAVTPSSSWTGESQFSGAYVSLPPGSTVRLRVPSADQSRLVMPVVDLREHSGATTTWRTGDRALGRVDHGRIGAQGAAPAPGALLPVTLSGELPAQATDLSAAAAGGDAVVDAVLLEPLVSRLVLAGDGGGVALLRSSAREPRKVQVTVPGTGPATVEVYDARGTLRDRRGASGSTLTVAVLAGGFTIVRR